MSWTPAEESFSASGGNENHVRALSPGPWEKAAGPPPALAVRAQEKRSGRRRQRAGDHWRVFAATSRRRRAAPQPSAPWTWAVQAGCEGPPLEALKISIRFSPAPLPPG